MSQIQQSGSAVGRAHADHATPTRDTPPSATTFASGPAPAAARRRRAPDRASPLSHRRRRHCVPIYTASSSPATPISGFLHLFRIPDASSSALTYLRQSQLDGLMAGKPRTWLAHRRNRRRGRLYPSAPPAQPDGREFPRNGRTSVCLRRSLQRVARSITSGCTNRTARCTSLIGRQFWRPQPHHQRGNLSCSDVPSQRVHGGHDPCARSSTSAAPFGRSEPA